MAVEHEELIFCTGSPIREKRAYYVNCLSGIETGL